MVKQSKNKPQNPKWADGPWVEDDARIWPSNIAGRTFTTSTLRRNIRDVDDMEALNDKSSKKKLRELNVKLNEIKRQQKELDEKITKQNQKISSDKNRTIETLGVFVALFTFISGQVQIFQKVTQPRTIVGLSLVTGGLITFFVLILDLMIKTHDEAEGLLKTRFFLLLGLSVAMVSAGSTMAIVR